MNPLEGRGTPGYTLSFLEVSSSPRYDTFGISSFVFPILDNHIFSILDIPIFPILDIRAPPIWECLGSGAPRAPNISGALPRL